MNPAALLGIADERGKIAPGRRADLVLFEWDDQTARLTDKLTNKLMGRLNVAATIVNGEIVYQKEQS